jgi:hypothetical protein
VRRRERAARIEFGDWQTPAILARLVVNLVARLGVEPASVLEPTCGRGALLEAAMALPSVRLARGFEIDEAHAEAARSALAGRFADIFVRDFFTVDWGAELGKMPEPILVLGNPPWVTSADLGALGSGNLPRKSNFKRLSGLDALTGKSNFDVSESMILRLVAPLVGRHFFLAMLCKSTVSRRIMEFAAGERWPVAGAIRRIDAKEHFNAAVDAVLLTIAPSPDGKPAAPWPVYAHLDAPAPERTIGVVDGRVHANVDLFHRTRHLEGTCVPAWRSGLKHDCAPVMELERTNGGLENGLGERVEIEDEYVFPLLKGSDVANRRPAGRRFVLVPQRCLGEDTRALRERAPKTFDYLERHAERLAARKSSIYKDRPPFSVFGVGGYTFSPYKVAVCGLYKRLEFVLIEPFAGRPVLLDDTCYFLPFEDRDPALAAAQALAGEDARRFFEARIFWDEKRPIGKTLLQSLSLETLVRAPESAP